MSNNLNEAVALLNDLLALARTTTSVVNQARLDAAIDAMADAALTDVERFRVRLEADLQAAADAATEAEAAAVRHADEQADRDARALTQEEEDQAQREERMRLGVS